MIFPLAVLLGSGIEIENSRVKDAEILFEDSSGIHRKVIYKCLFDGYPLLVLQGRKHFYEGHKLSELTENIKIIKSLGIKNLVITNAAGGVNDNFAAADLMLIRSHVNLNSILVFKKKAFSYSKELQEKFELSCIDSKVKLQSGIYGYYQGPAYETKAEIRFQKKFNIDAAGMSTIPEVNEASLNGINVIAVSVITNLLKENNIEPANHESVLTTAKAASENLNKVISGLIKQLN